MARTLSNLVAAVALGLATLALAGPAAAETLHGYGWVGEIAADGSSVTVDDRTFQVTSGTEILDLDGRPIRLAQVPLRTAPVGTAGQQEPGSVRYEAVRVGGALVLTRLTLVEMIPR